MDAMFNYYKNSLTNNLCEEYKGCWRKAMNNKEELMRLALRQQSLPHLMTYAYEGKGLTKDYLLSEFGLLFGRLFDGVDGVEGFTSAMYVGNNEEAITIEADVTALLWCDCLDVEIIKTKCPNIYIGCDSYVNLDCQGFNSVRVNLFDTSTLVIDVENLDPNTSVSVYKYSRESNVVIDGESPTAESKIKIFEKELRL